MTNESNPPSPSDEPVVARADFQYRWRVYALTLLLVGYGLWSLYDGFIDWPRKNAEWKQMDHPPRASHSELDLLLNQFLGIMLPAIGLTLFAVMIYRSRGAYRLTDGTLKVPGHPAVPLERIRSLDKSRWDRKGIAEVEYELADGTAGTISLRDMIYQRAATDEIVGRIESHMNPAGSETHPVIDAPQTS